MPPTNANSTRNGRGRPRNILPESVTAETRGRGRVAGQVVRGWGTRVPNAGDRIEEARIIVSPEVTWKYVLFYCLLYIKFNSYNFSQSFKREYWCLL